MNIRSASFRDLGRIEQLHREAVAREDDGAGAAIAGADSPVPQTTLVRLWYGVSKALSGLVPVTDSGTSLLVAEDGEGGLAGFIAAQGVPGQPKAWHVTNLCVAPTARGHFAGAPLLQALVNQGVEHSVTRYMVRVPLGHPLLGLFLEQGFSQYATEQILFRDDSGGPPRLSSAEPVLRPARREDVGAIHLLYLRTAPSHVHNVEGPSQKAWMASFQGGCMTRLGRDDMRHLVCERPGVVAWAGVRAASQVRPALLCLMCDGQDARLRDEVVDAALAHLAPGPVSCVLRHYDSELIRTLQRRGFEVFGSQLLLVRDLAVRVRAPEPVREKKKKHAFAHAGLARSLPAPLPIQLPSAPSRAHPQRSSRSSPR
jgi:hypothetical protein